MPAGKDGVWLRVGNMDGKRGWEVGKGRWSGQGECVEVGLAKVRGKNHAQ